MNNWYEHAIPVIAKHIYVFSQYQNVMNNNKFTRFSDFNGSNMPDNPTYPSNLPKTDLLF